MSHSLSFGVFELDTRAHQLRRHGQDLSLPPKAIDALELLVTKDGELMTRSALIEALWPDRVVEEQGLNQLIYVLRKTLGPRDNGEPWIITVPKRGYRFNGRATRSQPDPISPPAAPTSGSNTHPADSSVRSHLLRSRFLWHQWRPDAWSEAIHEARRALEIDPGNAEARYWWGASLITQAISGLEPPLATFPKARELLRQAVEIDPELDVVWEGLGAIALFHDWDADTACRHLKRAIQSNPQSGTSRDLFALATAASGDLDQALEEVEAALKLDPVSAIIGTDLGAIHAMAGRHDRAVEAFRSVLALHPLFAHARAYLSLSLCQIGEVEAALSEAHRAMSDAGRDPELSSELALAWIADGRSDRAEHILDRMRSVPEDQHLDAYFPMQVASALGRMDEALDWLDRAIEQRSRSLCYIRVDPFFDPLCASPGFPSRLERVLRKESRVHPDASSSIERAPTRIEPD